LDLVARRSGLEDRLFRPLSARFLPEALPIARGWIRLEDLPAITGRGRGEQIALAADLGIVHVPQSAGGCLLTEKVYASRLRDAFAHHDPDALPREAFELLGVGRQFRLSDTTKVIVGRDERENEELERLAGTRLQIVPRDTVGPTTLVEGVPNAAEIRLAAGLAARYCDHEGDTPLAMRLIGEAEEHIVEVTPLARDDPRIGEWRIT
jgi:hypothetical protein